MKFSYVFAVMIFLTTATSLGSNGFDRGNGGDAVICFSESGERTIQLLDWYEASTHNFEILWIPYSSRTDSDSILNLAIQRVESRYPKFGYLLRMYKQNMRSSMISVLDSSSFPDIKDEGKYSIADNCFLRQMAINALRPLGVRYYINQDLYNSVPPVQQAMLLMHELVYQVYLVLDPSIKGKSSELVRKINGLIFGSSFESPINADFLNKHLDVDGFAYRAMNEKN